MIGVFHLKLIFGAVHHEIAAVLFVQLKKIKKCIYFVIVLICTKQFFRDQALAPVIAELGFLSLLPFLFA